MEVARFIDHTLLKPDATPVQIEKLCCEAQLHGFASVCVNSSYVPLCAELLHMSNVTICTVVGFPLGAMNAAAKIFETKQAISDGAREIDMVMAVGRLKAGDLDYVFEEVAAVTSAAHARGAIVKVIIETALLNEEEKRTACQLCVKACADFVKTCTGFGGGGATIEDVRLMKTEVGGRARVKASGGIRDYPTVIAMIEAGAARIGTSSGVAIIQGDTKYLK